jgi:CRISPR-associated protein Csb2
LTRISVARFLLDGPVRPLLTDTVRVAESFRIAAMSRFKTWCLRHPELASEFQRPDKPDAYASAILAGKDLAGVMLPDHGHAYYLPTVEGDDPRRITHVTVIATDGFGPGEIAALNSVRFIKGAEEGDDLRVQLIGLGQPKDLNHWLFQSSRVWRSRTPFLGPAHLGRFVHDRDLRKAVRKECRRWIERGRLAAGPVEVEIVPRDPCRVPALAFRRQRQRRGQQDGYRPGAFVRLTFDRQVAGPICLGYASHFGLGLFEPEL